MGKRKLASILTICLLLLALLYLQPSVLASVDTTGGTGSYANESQVYVFAFPITISANGVINSIGINREASSSANIIVGLYSSGSGKPATLLTSSGSVALNPSTGWQDISVPAYSMNAGNYWVTFQLSKPAFLYRQTGLARSYYSHTYGSLDPTWSSGSIQDTCCQENMRVTYTTGPPPLDFTITASPTTQTISAGAAASYSLSIQYSPSLSTTVSLAVTSGCPSGVICTVTPNSVNGSASVTLSVPTLITTATTTPVTFSVVVTASNSPTPPILSHTVSVQLTVNPPGLYPVNVHAGATQVVVTLSWIGSGTAAVYLQGPGGTPLLTESGAVVYDRVTFVSGSSTPTDIHRVTFELSPSPTLPQTWTVLVSLSASYTVTVEVS